MNTIILYRLDQKLRSVPIDCKRVLASTSSEVRMAEVNVVVIIFSAHPVKMVNILLHKLFAKTLVRVLTRKLFESCTH